MKKDTKDFTINLASRLVSVSACYVAGNMVGRLAATLLPPPIGLLGRLAMKVGVFGVGLAVGHYVDKGVTNAIAVYDELIDELFFPEPASTN